MAILYGMSGKATGKKGDAVYTVRNGVQIVRQYNPIIKNPSTAGQVESRAKLKLMAQVGAILAPVIAMRSEGTKSFRNVFAKVNYPLLSYTSETAKIDLTGIQLTKSARFIENISISRSQTEEILVELDASVFGQFDRVIYSLLTIEANGEINLAETAQVEVTSLNAVAAHTFSDHAQACVVLAYGVAATSERARGIFETLNAAPATAIASLVSERTVSTSDLVMSKTVGAKIASVD